MLLSSATVSAQFEVDFGSPGVVMDRFELLPAGAAPVPEPTVALMLPGAGVLLLRRRVAGSKKARPISMQQRTPLRTI